jgi:hypothetical protein
MRVAVEVAVAAAVVGVAVRRRQNRLRVYPTEP